MAITNSTSVKSSMAPQPYKVISTQANEISGWTILSRLLHSRATHFGGMNGDIQSDLATLVFKNGEQLEDFHIRVIRLQQEIILSGEIVSPNRLLIQYTKALINSKKIRAPIAPNIIDFINFLGNNRKSAVYTGGDIRGIYRYLDMIGAPSTLNTSSQRYRNLGPSSFINNDAETLQPLISALRMRQKGICEFCGIIRDKADACIICGPKFLSPILRRNMNQFNTLHGEEPK